MESRETVIDEGGQAKSPPSLEAERMYMEYVTMLSRYIYV